MNSLALFLGINDRANKCPTIRTFYHPPRASLLFSYLTQFPLCLTENMSSRYDPDTDTKMGGVDDDGSSSRAATSSEFAEMYTKTMPSWWTRAMTEKTMRFMSPEAQAELERVYKNNNFHSHFAAPEVIKASLTEEYREKNHGRKRYCEEGVPLFRAKNITGLEVIRANEQTGIPGLTNIVSDRGVTMADMSAKSAFNTPGVSSDAIGNFMAVATMFGKPQAGSQPIPIWQHEPRNYSAFPEALRGTSKDLAELVFNLAFTRHTWQLTDFAPIESCDTEKIRLFQWIFDSAIADRVPYEVPVNILTHRKSMRSYAMINWGIGLYVELNFLHTAIGQITMGHQLTQITNCVDLTLIYGAVVELLAANRAATTDDEKQMRPPTRQEHEDLKEKTIEQFDILKKPHGASYLILEAREYFNTHGVDTSAMRMVVTPLSKLAMRVNPSKSDPEKTGKAIDDIPTDAEAASRYLPISDVKTQHPITTGFYSRIDPMTQFVTHGEFFVMDPRTMYPIAADGFTTQFASCQTYTDPDKRFTTTMYRDAFRASCLYDYGELEKKADGVTYVQTRDTYVRTLFPPGDRHRDRRASPHAMITQEIGWRYFNPEAKGDKMKIADVNAMPTARAFYQKLDKGLLKILETKIRKAVTAQQPEDQKANIDPEVNRLLNLKLHTSEFWDWCFDNHVPVMIPLIVAAPHQHRGCDAVAFYNGNGKSAKTYVGRCSWSEAPSGTVDVAKYALRFVARTVATPTGTYVAPCANVKSYLGGNDRTYWTYGTANLYNNVRKASTQQNTLPNQLRSRFVFALDLDEELENSTCIDLTGYFQDYYDGGMTDGRAPKAHYRMAPVYSKYWKFEHTETPVKPGDHMFIGKPARNTIVYHCHMLLPSGCDSRAPAYDIHHAGFGHMAHCAYNDNSCYLARTGKGPVDFDVWKDLRYKPYRSTRF